MNHPVVDGNKRTGFVVGMLFLEMHGLEFVAPQELATVAVLDPAAGRTGLDGYERFLRDHVRRIASDLLGQVANALDVTEVDVLRPQRRFVDPRGREDQGVRHR